MIHRGLMVLLLLSIVIYGGITSIDLSPTIIDNSALLTLNISSDHYSIVPVRVYLEGEPVGPFNRIVPLLEDYYYIVPGVYVEQIELSVPVGVPSGLYNLTVETPDGLFREQVFIRTDARLDFIYFANDELLIDGEYLGPVNVYSYEGGIVHKSRFSNYSENIPLNSAYLVEVGPVRLVRADDSSSYPPLAWEDTFVWVDRFDRDKFTLKVDHPGEFRVRSAGKSLGSFMDHFSKEFEIDSSISNDLTFTVSDLYDSKEYVFSLSKFKGEPQLTYKLLSKSPLTIQFNYEDSLGNSYPFSEDIFFHSDDLTYVDHISFTGSIEYSYPLPSGNYLVEVGDLQFRVNVDKSPGISNATSNDNNAPKSVKYNDLLPLFGVFVLIGLFVVVFIWRKTTLS